MTQRRKPKPRPKPKPKLRHIKTVMQHHFVVDDGKTLTEYQSEPVQVSAQEFTDYPEKFEAQRVEQERELNIE